MSGPIRKLIGPAKVRLQKSYEEANTTLSFPVQEETMEDEKELAEELIERMNTNVNLLEKCNRDWVNLLKDLGAERKTAEEKEYDRMGEGEEGFVEVLLDAKEAVARLQARLVWITKMKDRRTLLNPDAVAFQSNTLEASAQSPVNLSSQGQSGNLKVSLPKLQLLTFNGDIQQWPEFWDMFNSVVHEQTLTTADDY